MEQPAGFPLLLLVLVLGPLASSASSDSDGIPPPIIVPSIITDAAIRSKDNRGRTLTVIFPPQLPLKRNLQDWELRQNIDVAVQTPRQLAYGLQALLDTICPGALTIGPLCFAQVNESALEMRLLQDLEYDTPHLETVQLTFEQRIFQYHLLLETVSFSIHPIQPPIEPVAWSLLATLGAASVASSLVLPTALDSAMFLLPMEMNCARLEQRALLPYSVQIFLPLGWNSMFERVWVTVAVTCALVLLTLVVINLHHRLYIPYETAAFVRKIFTFVFLQVVLFFVPGMSFAAGQLISSNDAPREVLGTLLIFAISVSLYAVHGWLFRNAEWEYVCVTEEQRLSTCGDYVKHFFSGFPSGTWKHNDTPKLAAAMCRRTTQPTSDRLMPLFWFISSVFYLVAGLEALAPVHCLAQHFALAVVNLISINLQVKLKLNRSNLLTAFAVTLQLLSGLLYIGVSFQYSNEQVIGFFILEFTAVAVLLARIIYVLCWLSRYDQEILAVLQNQVTAEVPLVEGQWDHIQTTEVKKEEAEEQRRGGEAAVEEWDHTVTVPADTLRGVVDGEELLVAPPPAAIPRRNHGPDSQSNSEDEDEEGNGDRRRRSPDSDNEYGSSLDNGSFAATSVSNGTSNTATNRADPDWILNATREKRRRQDEDSGPISRFPRWFPKERPHVRSHNEPDLPLKLSPYHARSGRGRREGLDML